MEEHEPIETEGLITIETEGLITKASSIPDVGTFPLRTKAYGRVTFRGVSLGDLIHLERLVEEQVASDRDFAVRVLQRQLKGPELTLQEVARWPDSLLKRACRRWSEHPESLNTNLPPRGSTYLNFRRAVEHYVTEHKRKLAESMQPILRSAGQQLEAFQGATALAASFQDQIRLVTKAWSPSIEALQKSIAVSLPPLVLPGIEQIAAAMARQAEQVARAMAPALDVSRLIPKLPDLFQVAEVLEELQESEDTLRMTGYGFVTHLLSVRSLRRLARGKGRAVAAHVTRRFLGVTRGYDFQERLLKAIDSSEVLIRRREIVGSAWEAHRRREYVLSIPALLAQVEGTIADMLILRGSVVTKTGKLYERETSGSLRLDSKGQPIEVRGLRALVERSAFRDHPVLETVSTTIVDHIAPGRNEILHGRSTSYGRAKLSTQVLLLLLVLAQELEAFESGRFEETESSGSPAIQGK